MQSLKNGWGETEIGEICDLNPKHDKDLSDDLEVSFVPMPAVSDTHGTMKPVEIKPLGKVRRGYTHFQDDDVLFAKITPCMENGKAAIARGLKNGLGCGSTEFFVLRPNNGVDKTFLHRFVRQKKFTQEAQRNMTGAVGQARVPKDYLLSRKLPIPPLNEQKRIVTKLEACEGRIGAAREALDEVPALLEQYRQSVLAAAFRGDLTRDWREANPDVEPASELLARLRKERRQKWEEAERAKYEAKGKTPPKGWEKRYPTERAPTAEHLEAFPELPTSWSFDSLENLCDPHRTICYGVIKLGDEIPGGIPCLRTSNVRALKIETEIVKTISEKIAGNYERTSLIGDEVLVNVRGTLGGVAVAPPEMAGWNISREVAMAAVLSDLNPQFVAIAIASLYSQQWLTGVLKGVAYTGINIGDLKNLPIPIPPRREQDEIVEKFDQSLRRLAVLSEVQRGSTVDLTTLTQSLLAKAFRGELVPQDPADEPASELLVRIRAEREAEAAKKSVKNTTKKAAQKRRST